jgi:dihydrolipoamide dehydrogenase
MKHTDLLIIGAGPGGYETAVSAAQSGLTVTLIEEKHLGGTCLNEGCIPTKAFCKNAEAVATLQEGEALGLEQLSYHFNFARVVERKDQVVSTLRAGIQGLLQHKLITLVEGRAQFIDAHTVSVSGSDETYEADHLIIATGSVSKSLPIPGKDLPGVVTSKEILELKELPATLCIIGAGVIGLEFASIFSRFGTQVTVVEYAKEILPNFDTDLAKRLRQSLGKRGIEIAVQAQVTAIEQTPEGLSVHYQHKGTEKQSTAALVLMAVGRGANVQSLNLADAGIEFTPRGIPVNDNMQTNVPHIYAIGDVNARCMLAHAATFQGQRALNHLRGETDQIRFDLIPGAVFTAPEAAMVGLTEEQCKAQGIAYVTKKSFFRANGKALAMNEPDGYCKLLVATDDQRILGCHLFGAHSADLIQEVTALMNQDITLPAFRQIIHGHPTLGEVVQSALHS